MEGGVKERKERKLKVNVCYPKPASRFLIPLRTNESVTRTNTNFSTDYYFHALIHEVKTLVAVMNMGSDMHGLLSI